MRDTLEVSERPVIVRTYHGERVPLDEFYEANRLLSKRSTDKYKQRSKDASNSQTQNSSQAPLQAGHVLSIRQSAGEEAKNGEAAEDICVTQVQGGKLEQQDTYCVGAFDFSNLTDEEIVTVGTHAIEKTRDEINRLPEAQKSGTTLNLTIISSIAWIPSSPIDHSSLDQQHDQSDNSCKNQDQTNQDQTQGGCYQVTLHNFNLGDSVAGYFIIDKNHQAILGNHSPAILDNRNQAISFSDEPGAGDLYYFYQLNQEQSASNPDNPDFEFSAVRENTQSHMNKHYLCEKYPDDPSSPRGIEPTSTIGDTVILNDFLRDKHHTPRVTTKKITMSEDDALLFMAFTDGVTERASGFNITEREQLIQKRVVGELDGKSSEIQSFLKEERITRERIIYRDIVQGIRDRKSLDEIHKIIIDKLRIYQVAVYENLEKMVTQSRNPSIFRFQKPLSETDSKLRFRYCDRESYKTITLTDEDFETKEEKKILKKIIKQLYHQELEEANSIKMKFADKETSLAVIGLLGALDSKEKPCFPSEHLNRIADNTTLVSQYLKPERLFRSKMLETVGAQDKSKWMRTQPECTTFAVLDGHGSEAGRDIAIITTQKLVRYLGKELLKVKKTTSKEGTALKTKSLEEESFESKKQSIIWMPTPEIMPKTTPRSKRGNHLVSHKTTRKEMLIEKNKKKVTEDSSQRISRDNFEQTLLLPILSLKLDKTIPAPYKKALVALFIASGIAFTVLAVITHGFATLAVLLVLQVAHSKLLTVGIGFLMVYLAVSMPPVLCIKTGIYDRLARVLGIGTDKQKKNQNLCDTRIVPNQSNSKSKPLRLKSIKEPEFFSCFKKPGTFLLFRNLHGLFSSRKSPSSLGDGDSPTKQLSI